jgi:hypothetical protein
LIPNLFFSSIYKNKNFSFVLFFFICFSSLNSTRRFLTMPSGPRRLATTPPLGNRRPLTQVKRYGFEVRAPRRPIGKKT